MVKRGQSAVEFMLLITAVLFICIPAFYLLVDYSLKQSDDANRDQIMHMSQTLVDESREMYYLGRFSKEVITIRMPKSIDSMSTLSIDDEHYLIINYTYKRGKVDLAKSSDVPLITDNCYDNPCYTSSVCRICQFEPRVYRAGNKEFRIETVPYNSVTAVNLTSLI